MDNIKNILDRLYFGELVPFESEKPTREQYNLIKNKRLEQKRIILSRISNTFDLLFKEYKSENYDLDGFKIKKEYESIFILSLQLMIECFSED